MPSVLAPDAAADAVVAEALALVSRVRQLAATQRVPGRRLGRAALRVEVERLMNEDAPPELLDGNAEVLFALDTVPVGFDLKAALASLYGAQLAGFYDPESKRMVLASDLGDEAERMTLYHELVHALQDQHYDLAGALDWKPESSDVQGALHALAEGDATSAMVDTYAAYKGVPAPELSPDLLSLDGVLMQAAPELARVPAIVKRSLVAPYADGLRFVASVRQRWGDWAGVDRAWRQQPMSTEQVLHPEKLWPPEPVVAVAPIPPPPGFGLATFRDVLGEQGLRLVFEEWAPTKPAAEAASDWGGDRLAVFGQGELRVVALHLVFDTEAAAERALVLWARGALRAELVEPPASDAPALRALVESNVARTALRSGSLCQERAIRGPFAIARHGGHIGVVLGPYLRRAPGVRSAGKCPDALAWAQKIARSN